MSDTTDIISVFLMWMFLDLTSLITFKKSVKEPRNWKKKIQFKSIIANKHSSFSLVIEITAIIFVIYSFSIPWYYHLLRGFYWEYHFLELYFIEAVNLYDIFPGIILLFSVQFDGRPSIYLLIFGYVRSGFSAGFIIYAIGITVLLINALQFSVYSRFFQS